MTRISINPQSMHNDVLRAIGRRHTVEDTLRAFSLARDMGFDNINMDLIAGLPLDTPEKFRQTLKAIEKLSPESVTGAHPRVKTRGPDDAGRRSAGQPPPGRNRPADGGRRRTGAHPQGYAPYYLYRQSRMAGNLENTGWSRKGKELLYNIITMDEIHTVLSCGAGA